MGSIKLKKHQNRFMTVDSAGRAYNATQIPTTVGRRNPFPIHFPLTPSTSGSDLAKYGAGLVSK